MPQGDLSGCVTRNVQPGPTGHEWYVAVGGDRQKARSQIDRLRGNRGNSSGSHPQAEEKQEFSYSFFSHLLNGEPPMGRWCEGQSIDGKGQFDIVNSEPMGQKPVLNPARPRGGAQAEQI